jgi:hypothetical protein
VIAAPSSHARKTCRAGGFQQAPKSSGGHQLISKIYFKTI